MPDYLSQVSIFDSATALFVILGVNWAFTLIHILQEWKGEDVPLWRVFGAVVGVWIPHRLGFLSFTVALCAIQWLIGLMAIAGWLPFVGSLSAHMWLAVWALGVLIGARIGDSGGSHLVLYGVGYPAQPRLSSTRLYVAGAVFLLATFHKGLWLHPVAAGFGVLCGAGAFVGVLPALRGVRRLKPAWRRDAWVRGHPIPAWAKE